MSRVYKGKVVSIAAAALLCGNISIAATSVADGNTFDASNWNNGTNDTNITVVDSTNGSVDFDIYKTNDTNDTLDIDAGNNAAAILDWNKLGLNSSAILNFSGSNSVYLNKIINGGLAQLGERRVRNAKVRSSILLGSTNSSLLFQRSSIDK